MPSDAELLDQWRGGDVDAGETLFERHFDAVLRFFRNKVGGECEELVQRTFMACLEKRDTLRRASSFRSFLFGIARLELLQHFRRKYRHAGDMDVDEVSVHDLDPSPSRIVAQREEQMLLVTALRRIPIDLQIVLELHYWERLSMDEIAQVVQVPTGTVKSRLRRAREKLEEVLRGLVDAPELRRSTIAGIDGWAAEIREQLRR